MEVTLARGELLSFRKALPSNRDLPNMALQEYKVPVNPSNCDFINIIGKNNIASQTQSMTKSLTALANDVNRANSLKYGVMAYKQIHEQLTHDNQI